MKDNGLEKKNKTCHSIWSNYRGAFSWMKEMEGAGYPFWQGVYVILAVAQPFLAMAMPGVVVYLLGSGREPEWILLLLGGYVLVLQGMHVAVGYLGQYCKNKQMQLRLNLGTQYFDASMDADYQALESKAGQKMLGAAGVNLYFGNNRGIEAFLKALGNFQINLLGLILYSVVIGRQNLGILALSLLTAGAAAGIHGYAHKRAVKYDEEFEKVWQEYSGLGREVLVPANGKDIRLYHMWNWFSGEFHRLQEKGVYWGYRYWKCNRGYAGVAENCLAFVRNFLVYGYLIGQMMQGNLELGTFLVYVGVAAGFGGWMNPLMDALAAMLENNRYMDDYRVFLEFAEAGMDGTMGEQLGAEEAAAASRAKSGKRLKAAAASRAKSWKRAKVAAVSREELRKRGESESRLQGETGESVESRRQKADSRSVTGAGRTHEIRLEHVSFRYEGNREDTIHDLSLTIAPGEKVALVGMNGAGKSTLIKLICGLYHPTSGRIFLDGKEISGFYAKDYYREFAVVFQDVFAFSFRLGDNVTCAVETDADKERLRASLQKAELWDKVQTLENRERTYMNTDIDVSGVRLSGGELQKLMLARALYKDAPVLILDEPTAALDPIAESRLYEKYYEMTREKTSIFISHRLSSTKFCDRILFMEDGRITEEGGHEELLARQGAYAAMFHTQARYYQTKKEAL